MSVWQPQPLRRAHLHRVAWVRWAPPGMEERLPSRPDLRPAPPMHDTPHEVRTHPTYAEVVERRLSQNTLEIRAAARARPEAALLRNHSLRGQPRLQAEPHRERKPKTGADAARARSARSDAKAQLCASHASRGDSSMLASGTNDGLAALLAYGASGEVLRRERERCRLEVKQSWAPMAGHEVRSIASSRLAPPSSLAATAAHISLHERPPACTNDAEPAWRNCCATAEGLFRLAPASECQQHCPAYAPQASDFTSKPTQRRYVGAPAALGRRSGTHRGTGKIGTIREMGGPSTRTHPHAHTAVAV